jgi:hypothetical protein
MIPRFLFTASVVASYVVFSLTSSDSLTTQGPTSPIGAIRAMLMADEEIRRAVTDGVLKIENFSEQNLSPASYDLSLGRLDRKSVV